MGFFTLPLHPSTANLAAFLANSNSSPAAFSCRWTLQKHSMVPSAVHAVAPPGTVLTFGGEPITAAGSAIPAGALAVDTHSLHRSCGAKSNSTLEAERKPCWDPGLSPLEPAGAGLCRLPLYQRKQKGF